jgi:hypothetical protein
MRAIHLYSSAVLCIVGACATDGDEEGMGSGSEGDQQHQIAFHGEVEAFPGFGYDTGLLPAASPVQLQLKFSAHGKLTADAQATVGGAGDTLAVAATPGSGKFALDAGVKAEARLKVAITGLPPYDGPIPGIENFALALQNEATFDPFLLSGSKSNLAMNLPETELPPIPLGSIPGKLIITVSSKSTVNSTLTGICAGLDANKVQFLAETATNATIVLKPKIVITVPIVGDKEFLIPEISFNTPALKAPMDLGIQDAVEGGSAPSGVLANKMSCAGVSCRAPETLSFMPSWVPQITAANQCSSAQVYAFVTACGTDSSSRDTCQTFLKAAENTSCSACLVTDSRDAKWGAIVDGYPNMAGCIAKKDPMQQMLAEGYAAAVQCEAAACSAVCEDATYDQESACIGAAYDTVCASYIDAYNTFPTGAAAACVDQPSSEDAFRFYANLFCGTGM